MGQGTFTSSSPVVSKDEETVALQSIMRVFVPLVSLTSLVLSAVASPLNGENFIARRDISQDLFNDLAFYFQYAASAYADSCPKPNGNSLVLQFSQKVTDTQGFVARDDNRKEIVVSLRGSESFTDALTDINILLSPFLSPGVDAPLGSLAHSGFLIAWNSVAHLVISTVQAELSAHPGYSLVSTGHSLGGALSSLAGISLQQNFPNRRGSFLSNVRMFTYGQPRTFNPIGAAFINSQFGDQAFRSVHTTDGVPTLIPRILGYRHHGIEYFQSPDPASPATTKKCAADGEDPTCSDSIPSQGLDDAHGTGSVRVGTGICWEMCTALTTDNPKLQLKDVDDLLK
ncbi:putative feruloyl esterase A [Psilocybe cubensis]|uniref:Feruloyl esterase A n=1 Tax=Psilocybe cubensis TaxID=181762 RepID=A0ACB8GUU0_PSICU|nr:putative feruloyl esterase A [Psilocybe cubensis]KAH9479234.1 putative feruloyl esterase A [Psilocybe cubensis]